MGNLARLARMPSINDADPDGWRARWSELGPMFGGERCDEGSIKTCEPKKAKGNAEKIRPLLRSSVRACLSHRPYGGSLPDPKSLPHSYEEGLGSLSDALTEAHRGTPADPITKCFSNASRLGCDRGASHTEDGFLGALPLFEPCWRKRLVESHPKIAIV